MTRSADAIVVGGGVVGICAAYYLSRRGAKVILLERSSLAAACSFANACLITASHSMPIATPGVVKKSLKWMLHSDSPLLLRPRLDWDLLLWLTHFVRACNRPAMLRAIPVMMQLSCASLSLFQELQAEETISFDYARAGLMNVFTSDHEFEQGVREAALLAPHGIEFQVLTGEQARALEPSLTTGVTGAVYFPHDAHGDCYRFSVGMAEAISRAGVDTFTHEAVTALFERNGTWEARSTSGTFSAKQVVVAAGSWTSALVKDLGVKIPLQPGKGYSITMPSSGRSPRIPVINVAKKVVITPLGNRLRLAGTMEFAGFDLSMTKSRSDAVLRGGMEILNMAAPQHLERWCGLRPCTPDGLPVISPITNHPGGFIATGHAMLGYTLGPITGKLIAELAAGVRPSIDIYALRADRF